MRGLLFFNTLFDENAGLPHRARPMLFPKCFVGGADPDAGADVAQGGTRASSIDWMIGSDQIDIDGVHVDVRRVPVFREGRMGLNDQLRARVPSRLAGATADAALPSRMKIRIVSAISAAVGLGAQV